MTTLLVSSLVRSIGQNETPIVTAIMVLVFMIGGFRLAFRILPPWVGRMIGDTLSFFMRLVLGTGNKGRK